MTLDREDIVVGKKVIRGVNRKTALDVASVLDMELVPHIYSGDPEFKGSRSGGSDPDVHMVEGSLERLLHERLESIGIPLEDMTEEEISQSAKILAKRI